MIVESPAHTRTMTPFEGDLACRRGTQVRPWTQVRTAREKSRSTASRRRRRRPDHLPKRV